MSCLIEPVKSWELRVEMTISVMNEDDARKLLTARVDMD
jgi:hypothetical protein